MRRSLAATVWMPTAALRAMLIQTERVAPLETGGVLVGYCVGRFDVVVVQSMGPGPKAIHETTWFVPDADFHEAVIADAYSTSGRRHVYLGDWHSHPNGNAQLSSRDRRLLKTIANTAEARMPFPIMAILGGRTSLDLVVWRYVGYIKALRTVGRTIEKCAVRRYESAA
jgi:integrative and conjugative element protein (TIGR02256 family)